MSGSRRGCCKCGSGGIDPPDCGCATGAVASVEDIKAPEGIPVSVSASSTVTHEKRFVGGSLISHRSESFSINWSGEVSRVCYTPLSVSFPLLTGPIVGTITRSRKATNSSAILTGTGDLRLSAVTVSPYSGSVSVSAVAVNVTSDSEFGVDVLTEGEGVVLGSSAVYDAAENEWRASISDGVFGFADSACCPIWTASVAGDMSTFAFGVERDCEVLLEYPGIFPYTVSAESVRSLTGTVGGLVACGASVVPKDCVDGPTPPGEPPDDPPEGDCCDEVENATGLYWPDAVDSGILECGLTAIIRRFNATTGAIIREWIVQFPPGVSVRRSASCRQFRASAIGARHPSGSPQTPTIPGSQSYAVSPSGFSGEDWFVGGGSTTNQVRTIYVAALLDFGDDDALPSGARMILDIHDGIRSTAPKVFSATITPGPLPGTIANVALSSARIGSTVMADLVPTGQDFYHTGDNSKWFFAGLLGWRQGATDTQSGSRWEIEIWFEPRAGGFGPCPPEPLSILAMRSSNPLVREAIERHMSPATKCRGCGER